MIKKDAGSVTVFAAIMLPALIMCVSFVIDLGLGHIVRAQMQTAADAGSLAGVTFSDDEVSVVEEEYRTRVRYIRKVYDHEIEEDEDGNRDCRSRSLRSRSTRHTWDSTPSGESCSAGVFGRSISNSTSKRWEVLRSYELEVQLDRNLARERASSMVEANMEHSNISVEIEEESYRCENPHGSVKYKVEVDPECRLNSEQPCEEPCPQENPYSITDISLISKDDDANAYSVSLEGEMESVMLGQVMSTFSGNDSFETFDTGEAARAEFDVGEALDY